MYWTKQRWAALAIHAALALVLLIWSMSSSLHFWTWAFDEENYAYGALIVLDGLALLGFVLYIARIETPLAHARHALPLVSAVPLGWDMHKQFLHLDGTWLTWGFTLGVTALLVVLSYVVWTTIERLFVTPVEAAKEYAVQQMESFNTRAAQLEVMQDASNGFVQRQLQRMQDAMQPRLAPMQPPALPMEVPMESNGTMQPAMDTTYQLMMPIEHPDFTYNATHYRCSKCNAVSEAGGRNARSLRQSSGRYGCSHCRG